MKLKIRVKKPVICYPGSTVQQSYGESLTHGYLHWKINDRDRFDVKFCELPNPKPFVTLDWTSSVKTTLQLADSYPSDSRFRIRSDIHIHEKDIRALHNSLKSRGATEVTFKIDSYAKRDDVLSSLGVAYEDLRNSDVLMSLIRALYQGNKMNESTWNAIASHVKGYLDAACSNEQTLRNVDWSLRHLSFENLFSYGSENSINFDNLNGIIGVFGQNRIGKSSIVGSIMYTLFNSTDRGPIKNLLVCNIREQNCSSRAVINVSGVDYVIERKTTKRSSKKGIENASTDLDVYKVVDGEAQDLVGEQRTDTEKIIRSLIGTSEDFMLTSLSAQGELTQFIDHGSARRRQILSRFLDLDVFDKMCELANKDANVLRSQLKLLPDKDWALLFSSIRNRSSTLLSEITDLEHERYVLSDHLDQLRRKLSKHSDVIPVSSTQLEMQQNVIDQQQKKLNSAVALHTALLSDMSDIEVRISEANSSLVSESIFVDELQKAVDAQIELESAVINLRHQHEKDSSTLKNSERSLKILDEVPCGDEYPTCKFIKDAHSVKQKIQAQREKVERASTKLSDAISQLQSVKEKDAKNRLARIKSLQENISNLTIDLSKKKVDLFRLETSISSLESQLQVSKARMIELEHAMSNNENAELVSMRSEIDACVRSMSLLDEKKMKLATENGKISSELEKLESEKSLRDSLLEEMKAYDVITYAFSRRGIPHKIVTTQLPLINVEIAKILAGIVDFTIELEASDDSDAMEIYINYGDSRRHVELCSGMEKMIASIAIRVALISVSTLPKTNMLILDEGFGSLDDASIEACNRLLLSLKRFFKSIIVITHVDGIKDTADTFLEITRNEKNSRILYE